MEGPHQGLCARDSCGSKVVVEKYLLESGESASHVQLACRGRHCAFPRDGNQLCVWDVEGPTHEVFNKHLSFLSSAES